MPIHTTESRQPGLCKSPKAFNAVDMRMTSHELILAMIDPEMFSVTDINQAIISAPAIRVDDAVEGDASSNNALQRRFAAVSNNLGVNTAIALEDAKDGSFAKRATSAFALDAPGTEIGFVHFDLARKRRLTFTIVRNAFANASQVTVDGVAVKACDCSDLSSIQVERKQPNDMPELVLADSCTDCVPVFHSHDSRLAPFC